METYPPARAVDYPELIGRRFTGVKYVMSCYDTRYYDTIHYVITTSKAGYLKATIPEGFGLGKVGRKLEKGEKVYCPFKGNELLRIGKHIKGGRLIKEIEDCSMYR